MTDEVRILPQVSPRLETGPIQFGEDLPGVFITADDMYFIASTCKSILENDLANTNDEIDIIKTGTMLKLIGLAERCILQHKDKQY